MEAFCWEGFSSGGILPEAFSCGGICTWRDFASKPFCLCLFADFSPLIKKRVLAGVEYLEFPQRVTVESIFFFNLEIVANLSISIFT